MPHNPYAQHRHSLRLRHYDYTCSSLYFLTLCSHDHLCLFGDVVDGEMHLSPAGCIAADEWLSSGQLRPAATLDDFVVMPNHLHAIIALSGVSPHPAFASDRRCAEQRAHAVRPYNMTRPPASLGSIVAGYKSAVTRKVRAEVNDPEMRVWQRNYYEHIIRNDDDLDRIRRYIRSNPAQWALDRDNPAHPNISQFNARRPPIGES